MKKLLIVGSLALMSIGAFAQKKAVLTFKSEKIEMGKLEQGTPAARTFEFTNTGKEPLQLLAVSPGCGCTAAEYTKTPVLPGKKGNIKVVYNAAAPGNFTKTISVQSNTEIPTKVLTITGEVVPKS